MNHFKRTPAFLLPIVCVALPLALAYLSMKTGPQKALLVSLVVHIGLSKYDGYHKIGKCAVFLLFPLSMIVVSTFFFAQLFEPISKRPSMPVASVFIGFVGGLVLGTLFGILYFKWIRINTTLENRWLITLAVTLFLLFLADKVIGIV